MDWAHNVQRAIEWIRRFLRQGCRIDLQVEGRDQSDRRVWLVWSEHKVGAEFGSNQLARYDEALRDEADGIEHRLIVVTVDPPLPTVQAQIEELGITALRWRDLSLHAEKAGTELAGASWRSYTLDGPGEISRRLLLDWLIFSESEELEEAEVDQLTQDMIDILPDAIKVAEIVEGLCEAAFEVACEKIDAGEPDEADECWGAAPPDDTWLARDGAELYVSFEPDDAWAVSPQEKPAFKAGMFLSGEPAERMLEDRSFRQRLTDDGFTAWEEQAGRGKQIDLAKPVAMDAVVSSGTPEQQKAALAEYFKEIFDQLVAYDFPETGVTSSS